jgi:peroxiredoxin (alkyl hydroperoxide reductase subunit C)
MSVLTPLEVGKTAPDFQLKGPGGQPVTLSEYHGKKNVVLVFFPLAFSPVCSHQLPMLEKARARIEALNAEVFGISVDSHFVLDAFASRLGLSFPLLSDFNRAASAAYGVLYADALHSGRAVFVIDRAGKVAYRDLSPIPSDPSLIPDNEKVFRALQALA